ncbi:MAG: PQQ-binding-like beta-propeller repeat protein [Thermoguttaceae bacterium]
MLRDPLCRCLTIASLSVALLAAASLADAADWLRYRGPQGTGVATDAPLPATWSAEENVVWKTPLPGFGSSSPIVLGDKLFLTCYSGYGVDADEPGEQEDLRHHTLCIDRTTGKILWNRLSMPRLPEEEYESGIALHGYASSTPVTDGEAVYCFFGRSGVWARKVDNGDRIWSASVGGETHIWGSANSPILAGDLLIVNASIESESIVALNKKTGQQVWQTKEIIESWSTPALVDLPGGKQELVVSTKGKVLGLDPASGEQLWECASANDYVCPIVVVDQDIVYISSSRERLTIAVRAGGRGDVTDTHLLWEQRICSQVPSPLIHEGLLYWVDDRAYAVCLDAKTGEQIYKERLDVSGGSAKVYASVVLADGKIYAVSRTDGTVVLAAGREFKVLAKNQLGDESVFNATPLISNGQLFLRSDKALYCIGE